MPRKALPRAIDLTAENAALREKHLEMRLQCAVTEAAFSKLCTMIKELEDVPVSKPNGRKAARKSGGAA